MSQEESDSACAGVQVRAEGALDNYPGPVNRLHRSTDPVAATTVEDRVAAEP
jgi:hypothetical protein